MRVREAISAWLVLSYETDPSLYKGSQWIVLNIVDCAAKGGNFMVGVGPDVDG